MPYGSIKVDNIVFTNGGVDQTVTVSGIVQSISGNITATGTIQGSTIIGTSTVSGATVTGNVGAFTAVTGQTAGFTTVTGTTVTGTTVNFVSGVYTARISGATVTGNTAQFTTLTGGTAGFTTITGTTVTGTTGAFTVITGGTAGFTTITGTTVTGTTANFATISGTTITGGHVTTASGTYTGSVTAASFIPTSSTAPTNGLYLSGTNTVGISTGGTGRLFVDASGNVGVGTSSITSYGANYRHLDVVGTTGAYITLKGTSTPISADFTADDDSVFFGSKTAHPIRFRTNDAEKARIRADGMFEVKGAGTAGSSPAFSVNGSAPASSLIIDSSGNASLGSASNFGSRRLSVNGIVSLQDGSAEKSYYYWDGTTTQLVTTGNNPTTFWTNSNERARIRGDGLFEIRGAGTAGSSPAVSFSGSAASNSLVVDSSSRVGIGTSSVDAKFHVAGDSTDGTQARITGATNQNYQLRWGFDTTNLVGRIQSIHAGTAYKALALNPDGGNVGIGTTSPGTRLCTYDTSGGNTTQFRVGFSDSYAWDISRDNAATGDLIFKNSNGGAFSERARIDSSGRLLVGTASARSTATLGTNYQALIEKAGDYAGFSVFGNKANNQGSYFVLGKSRGTTAGAVNAVAADDVLGYIGFEGTDGTSSIRAADIFVAVDGGVSVTAGSFVVGRRYKIATVGTTDFTLIGASANTVGVIFQATGVGTGTGTATTEPYANSMPGRLVFSTTADGAASPTERMRIASNGKTTIKGATSDSSAYSLEVTESGGIVHFTIRNDGVILTGTDTLSPYNNTTASAANLFVTSGGELQRSTSSLKYKKNVQDAPYGLQELMALRAVTYQGKSTSDGDTVYGGLIAEEVDAAGLQEFVQYADDGTPDALAYGNMVSLCIKAIQEQQAMIVELQAKVAALETA